MVNAAASSLKDTGEGINGAIHKAAGPELERECVTLSGCDAGGAKMTGAYNLPCKAVIHTVAPLWKGGKKHEEERLALCYSNSLKIAVKQNFESIAFPSVVTEEKHFPKKLAAETAVRAVMEFVDANPGKLQRVVWVLPDEETYNIYHNALLKAKAGRFVGSPAFDSMNRALRDGLV